MNPLIATTCAPSIFGWRTVAKPKLQLEVHEHCILSSNFSPTPRVRHSHPGGGIPHTHPDCGPAFYGYRKPKIVTRPIGEQMKWVAIPEEELSFDLVITDSALLGSKTPIGNTPLDEIFMPAADRMMRGFRLRCNVIDTRKETK